MCVTERYVYLHTLQWRAMGTLLYDPQLVFQTIISETFHYLHRKHVLETPGSSNWFPSNNI